LINDFFAGSSETLPDPSALLGPQSRSYVAYIPVPINGGGGDDDDEYEDEEEYYDDDDEEYYDDDDDDDEYDDEDEDEDDDVGVTDDVHHLIC
jgi:hypothetical protein